MIPILYGSNEVNFTSNGLGRLRSCIEAKVVEERNGIYEMDFSYPVDGENYDLIQLGRIIGVTHEDSDDIQPFDIVSCSRPIGGVVTFHCTHISYRQSKMVTYGTSVSTLTGAFRIFEQVFYPEKPLGYTSSGNPFVYETDKSGTAYIPAFDGTPRTIRSILGGVEGSILDTFGGEYEWDKWNVILHTARGSVKDFTIRYGVNLTDFQDDTDYGESFNTCIPFWKSTEGEVVIGSEINTEQSTVGVGDKCVPLDLSDKFEEQPTVADLEAMAADIMDANQPYLPKQNIKVDFVRLQDEAGFDQFDSLLQCKLCDSIKVIFPRYDMSAYFKIVKTTWNVLLDRYDSMELGNLSTTLAEALGITNGLGGEGGNNTIGFENPTDVASSMTSSPYWTCPANGIIVARAVSSGSATGIYIQDLTLNIQACGIYQNTMANNTQATCTAPVLKGHIYHRNYYSGQGAGQVYYYKFT